MKNNVDINEFLSLKKQLNTLDSINRNNKKQIKDQIQKLSRWQTYVRQYIQELQQMEKEYQNKEMLAKGTGQKNKQIEFSSKKEIIKEIVNMSNKILGNIFQGI